MFELTRHNLYVRLFCSLLLAILVNIGFAHAQNDASNTDHAIQLIVATADSVLKANNVQGYRLNFAYDYPVRIKLVERLFFMGYKVYDNQAENPDIITINVDTRLTYRFKGGRNESTRIVAGNIGITLTQSDGSIIATHLRQINESHVVTAKPVDLDDGIWPMVQFANIEDGGRKKGIKRIMEPALIVTSAAVTIFLLFNVRSQ